MKETTISITGSSYTSDDGVEIRSTNYKHSLKNEDFIKPDYDKIYFKVKVDFAKHVVSKIFGVN